MLSNRRSPSWGVLVVASGLVAAVSGCGAAEGTDTQSSQDLSSFEAVVEEAMAPATEWEGPPETPTPPRDISLAVVLCAGVVDGCNRQAQGVTEAAESLGWTVTQYDGKGDPVAQGQALTQALNSGADAVVMNAIDPGPLQEPLKLAAERGIPVATTGLGIAPGNGILFDAGADYSEWGSILGSWIAVDSEGTGVVLPMNDKEFASVQAPTDSLISTLEECEGCEVKDTEEFIVANIGNGLGQRVASILQRENDVNYVWAGYDAAASDMVPAIANAGLGERVKLVSIVGAPLNLGFIADGNVQAAVVAQDDLYTGFVAVDQMSRVLSGEPLYKTPGETDERRAYSQSLPSRLFTAENLDDNPEYWIAENDYVKNYHELWGIAG
jgi:ABC-type sugar transport system substrate-binding protein